MRFLVTGTAGFIGFHLARRLLADGHDVTGFDAMTSYYDVRLKEALHALLERSERFTAHIGRLEDRDALERAVEAARPDMIVHLAAQAGVRTALNTPYAGGHILERHAAPARGIHAIQIEFDRTLYLDSTLDRPGSGMTATVALLRRMIAATAEEALAGDSVALAAE